MPCVCVLTAQVLHVGLAGCVWAVCGASNLRCLWGQELVSRHKRHHGRHQVGHTVDVDAAEQEPDKCQHMDDV